MNETWGWKKKEGSKENSEKGETKSAFEGWPEKKGEMTNEKKKERKRELIVNMRRENNKEKIT